MSATCLFMCQRKRFLWLWDFHYSPSLCWNIFSEIPHRNSSSPWFPFLFNCHCSLFHRKNNARFSIVFLKINKEKNIQSLIQHSFIDFLVSWLQFHGWSCNLQVRGDQNIPRYAGSLFLLPGHG